MNGVQIADCEINGGVEQLPLDGEHNSMRARSLASNSGGGCSDCAEILLGLNNALAGTLLNAQVMEWKLPSHSRSKRYVHEIERNAQRGGELVKQLLARLQSICPAAVGDRPAGEDASSLVVGVVRLQASSPARSSDQRMRQRDR
jgi:hypothetical protein